MMNLIFRCISF